MDKEQTTRESQVRQMGVEEATAIAANEAAAVSSTASGTAAGTIGGMTLGLLIGMLATLAFVLVGSNLRNAARE